MINVGDDAGAAVGIVADDGPGVRVNDCGQDLLGPGSQHRGNGSCVEQGGCRDHKICCTVAGAQIGQRPVQVKLIKCCSVGIQHGPCHGGWLRVRRHRHHDVVAAQVPGDHVAISVPAEPAKELHGVPQPRQPHCYVQGTAAHVRNGDLAWKHHFIDQGLANNSQHGTSLRRHCAHICRCGHQLTQSGLIGGG